MGERETGMGEKDRKRDRVGERNTGEKEREIQGRKKKITNTKKFMEFYLVVLQSTVVLQSGYPKNNGTTSIYVEIVVISV